jgi:hypothetical protein
MADLDFDELDKAVSSIMATDSPAASGADNSTVATSVAPQKVDTTMTQPQAPQILPRKSGRFMDMIHPSSDMRSDVSAAPASASSASPAMGERVIAPLSATPAQTTVAAAAQPTNTATPAISMSVSAQDALDALADEASQQPSAIATPFVMDAQVTKRPLGAFADAAPSQPAENAETATPEETEPDDTNFLAASADEAQAKTADASASADTPVASETANAAEQNVIPDEKLTPEPVGEPLPPELSGDIVAVEANETELDPDPAEAHIPVVPAPSTGEPAQLAPADVSGGMSDASSSLEVPTNEQPVVTPDSPVVAIEPETDTATHFTPPATKSSDAEEHSVFDTQAYHQPLTVQPKGNRVLLWVALVVMLALVGSAIGAYWYLNGQ